MIEENDKVILFFMIISERKHYFFIKTLKIWHYRTTTF